MKDDDLSEALSKLLMTIVTVGIKILLLVMSLMIGIIAALFKSKS